MFKRGEVGFVVDFDVDEIVEKFEQEVEEFKKKEGIFGFECIVGDVVGVVLVSVVVDVEIDKDGLEILIFDDVDGERVGEWVGDVPTTWVDDDDDNDDNKAVEISFEVRVEGELRATVGVVEGVVGDVVVIFGIEEEERVRTDRDAIGCCWSCPFDIFLIEVEGDEVEDVIGDGVIGDGVTGDGVILLRVS